MNEDATRQKCSKCNGTGITWVVGDVQVETMTCPRCNGDRKVYEEWGEDECPRCMGHGVIRADGKCLFHPRFHEGERYGVGIVTREGNGLWTRDYSINDPVPKCVYCGHPAPMFEEIMKERAARKEKKKRDDAEASARREREKNVLDEIDDLKREIRELRASKPS